MDDIKTPVNAAGAILQQKLAEAKSKSSNPQQLRQAAEDFESLFVYYMLRTMRKTIPKSGLLGNGMGGDLWESMFDQQLATEVARGTSLGIAEMLIQQLGNTDVAKSGQEPELQPLPAVKPFRQGPTVPYSEVLKRLQTRASDISHLEKRLAPFEDHIRQAARQHGVNPQLIKAVILAESSGNPQAVSPKGAKGLMQLMDSTAAQMGVHNPLDPAQNILGGTRYLARLLDQFDGNLELALAAYNAGPTAVKKHGGIPPYPETRRYVQKIQQYLRLLSATTVAAQL